MRKPRPFDTWFAHAALFRDEDGWRIGLGQPRPLDPVNAERLAAWLLKAAEWIREKEGE